jgi:hypothetical protein
MTHMSGGTVCICTDGAWSSSLSVANTAVLTFSSSSGEFKLGTLAGSCVCVCVCVCDKIEHTTHQYTHTPHTYQVQFEVGRVVSDERMIGDVVGHLLVEHHGCFVCPTPSHTHIHIRKVSIFVHYTCMYIHQAYTHSHT